MNATGIPLPPPPLGSATEVPFAPVGTLSEGTLWPYQINGFIAALFVILASELGDKTFIITTIMAMKYSRKAVFLGALSAATLMITLSVLLGMVTTLIPQTLTHYLSVTLFTWFGIQMLREGFSMSVVEEENQAEALETIRSRSSEGEKASKWRKTLGKYLSFVFIETFTLNFFAEWGDRSQVSTILLAARENMVGVLLGAVTGQFICNALAVIGGKFIGKLISVRTVTLCGGFIFIGFAAYPLIVGN